MKCETFRAISESNPMEKTVSELVAARSHFHTCKECREWMISDMLELRQAMLNEGMTENQIRALEIKALNDGRDLAIKAHVAKQVDKEL